MKNKLINTKISAERQLAFNMACSLMNANINEINKVLECIGLEVSEFKASHKVITDDRIGREDYVSYVSEIETVFRDKHNIEYDYDTHVGFSVEHDVYVDLSNLYKVCTFKIYVLLCRYIHRKEYNTNKDSFRHNINRILISIDKDDIDLFKITLFEIFVGSQYRMFSDIFGGDAELIRTLAYITFDKDDIDIIEGKSNKIRNNNNYPCGSFE